MSNDEDSEDYPLHIIMLDISKVPRYMRAVNAEQTEEFRAATAAGRYAPRPSEVWWRDRNQILEDHGYRLRSRLRPGWEPSWLNTDVNPLFCEDRWSGCVSASAKSRNPTPVNMLVSHERSLTR